MSDDKAVQKRTLETLQVLTQSEIILLQLHANQVDLDKVLRDLDIFTDAEMVDHASH